MSFSSSLWTGCKVHPDQTRTFIHTPKDNLEKPFNLTGMSLDCGRKLEYPERTHARGEHANSMQKDPQLGVEPRTFLLQGNSATNCTAVQPACQTPFRLKCINK
ncbi:hypothetical protein ILYODFUR_015445 [Ilyodon furcidens]|uniref:Uncharacterized protein n=1 Tax=Ilyodon furcidens TaxID=33524 RepID=A0ABV0SM95_9TELE